MDISAVICTHNRCDYLRKAIVSLLDQTLAVDRFEIIVVDNCSTDDTRNVVLEEFSSSTNLRYIHEPVLGLSTARNTGWKAASGRYVAFLDDDAIAAREWLSSILSVFSSAEQEPGAVGGKVEPIWEAPRPPWLSDALAVYLAILDLSDTPFLSTSRPIYAGNNMAFPKHVLEETGGFYAGAGRIGQNLLSSEEVMLWEAIVKRGYAGAYHPDVVVRHHVAASRLTQKYLLRRMYWEGISQAVSSLQAEPRSFVRRVGLALRLIGRIAVRPRRMFDLLVPTHDKERFGRKCRAVQDLGCAAVMLGLCKVKS